MALPLIPIIAGSAIRTIARKAIPKLLKTANIGTLGYVGYDAAKEAKKGNYEPLGDLAQSYLLRGAPTLLKAKGTIVIDKSVGKVRKDKQTYIKEATTDPLSKGKVVHDVRGDYTPAKVNVESYNYQRTGSKGTRRNIADTQRIYKESVERDVKRTGAYTKDIKIDEVQAKAERRAVVTGVRREIKDAEKRGDSYTEFFMPGKSTDIKQGKVTAVVGSRLKYFKGKTQEEVNKIVAKQLDARGPFKTIISGESPGHGVDKAAKIYADKKGIEYISKPPKNKTRDALMARNQEIVDEAEQVIAITVGRTPGTANTIARTKAAKKPIEIIDLDNKTKNAETVLRRYLKRFFPSVKVTDVKATKATTKLAKKGSGGTDVTKIDTPKETLEKADALSTVAKYTYAKDRKTGKGIFVDNPFSRNVGIEYQNIVGRDATKNIIQTENIIKQTPTSRALSYMRFLAKSSKTKGLDNKIITNIGSGIPLMDDYGVALLRRQFRKDASNVGKITLKKGFKQGNIDVARAAMTEVGGTGTRKNVGAYKKFGGPYSPVNRSKEPNVDAAALRKLFAGYFDRNKPKKPKK